MADPVGGEDDFIVKSKPETKQLSFIHICGLITTYKHQDVCIQATCWAVRHWGGCVCKCSSSLSSTLAPKRMYWGSLSRIPGNDAEDSDISYWVVLTSLSFAGWWPWAGFAYAFLYSFGADTADTDQSVHPVPLTPWAIRIYCPLSLNMGVLRSCIYVCQGPDDLLI